MKAAHSYLRSQGPELFAQAQINNRAESGLLKVTGLNYLFQGMIAGNRRDLMSQTALETVLGHYPAGASFKSVEHFMQNLQRQAF